MFYTGIPIISKSYDLKPVWSSQEPLDDKLLCLLIFYKSLGSFIVGSKLNANQMKNGLDNLCSKQVVNTKAKYYYFSVLSKYV